MTVRSWSVACAAAWGLVVTVLLAVPAGATTATANISAGPLAVTAAPLQVASGLATGAQALEVSNATGSGAGWSITAAETASPGRAGNLLAASCVAGPGCVRAGRAYSWLTGRAVKVFDLAGAAGAGRDTVVLAWSFAGLVRGRWPATVLTVSLVAGP